MKVLLPLLWIALAAPLSAQSLIFTHAGSSAGEEFGYAVSGAGDVNGDGVPDVVVGAPGGFNPGNAVGNAMVLSGFDGSTLYHWYGDSAADWFGVSVSGAGDVNADGFEDVIVGANQYHFDGPGYARVFSGVDGTVLYNWTGDSPGDEFGYSVSGAGDVNGDGFADLIVGAPDDDDNGVNSGSARLFSGFDGSVLATWHGASQSDAFGRSVSDAGDTNGDGSPDIIVGAPRFGTYRKGTAVVFSGSDGSVLHSWVGEARYDGLGRTVSSAGDVNGDGFGDVVTGMPGFHVQGVQIGGARVFSGLDGSVLYTWHGDSWLGRFGESAAGAGDVNADGFDDVIVGAGGEDRNGGESGTAKVFSGFDGSIVYSWDGIDELDCLGRSVDGAGDVNGDGFADLIVGALASWNNSGNVRAFAGSAVSLTHGDLDPGTAGVPNTLTVTGAEPHGTVVFATRRSPGLSFLPCAGGVAPVNILNVMPIGTVTANANGEASISRTPPASLSGRTIRLQAVEFETCRFTNLVIYRFP